MSSDALQNVIIKLADSIDKLATRLDHSTIQARAVPNKSELGKDKLTERNPSASTINV